MALQGGYRFAVPMGELFPAGCYAVSVQQAEDFDERTGRRTPSKDKITGELVWTVTVFDSDPQARERQVRVKITGAQMPQLPEEVLPGLHPVAFTGLTVTPYVNDGTAGRRARMAYSVRASGMHAVAKAPAGSASGRAGGQAHTAEEGKAA